MTGNQIWDILYDIFDDSFLYRNRGFTIYDLYGFDENQTELINELKELKSIGNFFKKYDEKSIIKMIAKSYYKLFKLNLGYNIILLFEGKNKREFYGFQLNLYINEDDYSQFIKERIEKEYPELISYLVNNN